MHPLAQPDILKAIGLEDITPDEQLVFLSERGDEIFVSALQRYEGLLEAPAQESLHAFLATDPEPDALLAHLVSTDDVFLAVLRAVVAELKA